jgi:hypothetical protein
MTEIIAITFLSWSVVGVSFYALGYWNGKTKAWREAGEHFVDVRYQLATLHNVLTADQ